MKISLYYESTAHRDPAAPATPEQRARRFVDDVEYVVGRYGRHQAWLKVGGRPVVFVYGKTLTEIPDGAWAGIRRKLNEDLPDGVLLVADAPNLEDPVKAAFAAETFDGLHYYNLNANIFGMTGSQIAEWAAKRFPRWMKVENVDIACLTVIPGYDDSARPDRTPPRRITSRNDGQTYAQLWQAAINANPDWVLITSWNEWTEGSEIEPSKENVNRELKATGEYSRRFLQAPARTVTLHR
jgi:hypothetical protein